MGVKQRPRGADGQGRGLEVRHCLLHLAARGRGGVRQGVNRTGRWTENRSRPAPGKPLTLHLGCRGARTIRPKGEDVKSILSEDKIYLYL